MQNHTFYITKRHLSTCKTIPFTSHTTLTPLTTKTIQTCKKNPIHCPKDSKWDRAQNFQLENEDVYEEGAIETDKLIPDLTPAA